MTTITITPTGGADDSSKIQSTINGLSPGDTIQLNGNFKSGNPVKMPSNINWILNGSITATKAISILVNNGNISNIDMSGGTYRGIGQTPSTGRLVEFTNGVTNSRFSNMIFENADHTFGLSVGCSGNTCTNLIARNSINGLADRGNGNKWNDCVCEDNSSDNWIIKCKNSTFNRCIGRNSTAAVGFGFYARIDGSNDVGADISGNKFFDCQAYGNAHSGFSLNCPTNGAGAKINDNFIQAVVHDNGKKQDVLTQAGIYLRNKLSSSTLKNNQFDVLAYNNGAKGGLALEASFPITGNTGSFVVYGNNPNDINLEKGTGNTFTVFHPTDKPVPKIVKGTNNVTVTDFNCSNIPSAYCTQKYCGGVSPVLTTITIVPATVSININDAIQLTATCKDQSNNTMICPTLTWTSSDSSKAMVNSSGLVTGMTIGITNITAKSGSIISNSSMITVTTNPVEKKFSLYDVTNVGIMVILDDNGALTKTQACTDACAKLNQL